MGWTRLGYQTVSVYGFDLTASLSESKKFIQVLGWVKVAQGGSGTKYMRFDNSSSGYSPATSSVDIDHNNGASHDLFWITNIVNAGSSDDTLAITLNCGKYQYLSNQIPSMGFSADKWNGTISSSIKMFQSMSNFRALSNISAIGTN